VLPKSCSRLDMIHQQGYQLVPELSEPPRSRPCAVFAINAGVRRDK
jgi:hypothetical protein